MADQTAWRRALAAQVAAGYAAHPRVAAVALAGSVARGWADRHSDIELDVYWAAPPDPADRLAPISRAGAQIDIDWASPPPREQQRQIFDRTGGTVSQLWPHEGDEWSEHYYVRGVNVGISGFLAETVEGYLDDALVRHQADDERQMRLAAILHGVPLGGEALLERWRARAAQFPRGLSLALVREQLDDDESWWGCDMWVERGAHLTLVALLHRMQVKILRILLALNRIYLPDPRFKWAGRLVEQMAIHPENLGPRLAQVFALEPATAVRATEGLLCETLALVARELPEVDVVFAERWYAHRRPVNDAPRAG